VKTCCVVVIGHVDHGKTSLVRALTGTDTDRLPEEKTRGLSITPGYAHLGFDTGTVDFIDAPGHEDFIAAMIHGASGAQAALVVISVTEGICAQTVEHLGIARLLGITTVIIAVTKADLLAPEACDARLAEIRHSLRDKGFTDAKTVLCSALTGAGIDALRDELGALLTLDFAQSGPQGSFLPIDRVFTLEGRGTVVTGTLLGRDLSCDDALTLLPSGQSVSLRGLQARGVARDTIGPGERTAANLRGVSVAEISRGAVLCRGGDAAPSQCMDVSINLLPDCPIALKHNAQVRVLFGTTSEVAHVRLFGGGQCAPGGSGFAQLRFNRPVVGFAGQRAVLRRLSPPATLGGAVILDPQATPVRAGDALRLRLLQAVITLNPAAIAQALAQEHGGAFDLRICARLARRSVAAISRELSATFVSLSEGQMAAPRDIAACTAMIADALRGFHRQHPLKLAAPRTVLTRKGVAPALLAHAEAEAVNGGVLRKYGPLLALAEHDPVVLLSPAQSVRLSELEAVFFSAALCAPAIEGIVRDGGDQDLMGLLTDLGILVRLDNIALKQRLIFHRDTLATAAAQIARAFPAPQVFTTSQARTALATSRRIIVPVLEYFDAQGITVRNGDARRLSAFAVSQEDPA
jgi:selenocysteine-specific elongation factor